MAKYYHISQNLNLSPGDLFDNTKWEQSWYFGHKFNCSTNKVHDEVIGSIVDTIRKQLDPKIDPTQIEPGLAVIKNILLDGKTRGELLKEFLFESVRLSKFPDLPSRFRCAFFSDVSLNPKEICKAYGFTSDKRALYTLEDSGQNSNFKADPSHLNCNLAPPQKILEFAEKYWCGEKSPGCQIQEVLSIGTYMIIEKLDWPI